MSKMEEKVVLLGAKTTSADIRFVAIMKETAKEVELCRTNESMVPSIISMMDAMEPIGGYIDRLVLYKDKEIVKETILSQKTLTLGRKR